MSVTPWLAERALYSADQYPRSDYFLRKRSSRTTSAPSLGFAGSSLFSAAGEGSATGKADGAATAGSLAPDASAAASASDGSNCNPNCTDGSRKLLIAANG